MAGSQWEVVYEQRSIWDERKWTTERCRERDGKPLTEQAAAECAQYLLDLNRDECSVYHDRLRYVQTREVK